MPNTALVSAPLAQPTRLTPETLARRSSTRFLATPQGRIAYDDVGSGPLVVMVPSLGDLRQEYRELAPRLAAAGYRAVTMDLRGHGESSTGWPTYTNAAIGGDILALVKSLAAGPALVIGTSMGAGAAAWAAAEDQKAVAALVLIGPFVRTLPMAWWKAALMNTVVATAFVGPWGPAAWGAYYGSLYPTAKPADFAAYKAALVANLREPGRMAALQAMLRATKTDIERRLPEVTAPTLVVLGSKDPDFADPALEAKTVAGLLRGRAAMVEGAGHYPHVEMAEATAKVVTAFLAAVRPAPARTAR
jgi:pimeloyl-ACP methyl ester carboxylesterase